jgi:hypothetical protein
VSNDRKHDDINRAFREVRGSNRLTWNPTSSLDPAERQKDYDDFNHALRRAGGRVEPEEGAQSFPWTSLGSGAGDEEGST